MFVQYMRGRARDREGLKQQRERWIRELKPGAEGFVGSTAGVTAAGEFVALARFESAEAAAANGARPEQDAWWQGLVACLDGEPEVKNTTNIGTTLDKGNDHAGFVQLMEGSGDADALRALDEEFYEKGAPRRPDLLGGYTAFFDDGSFVEVAYFTSEAEARENEAQEMPPDIAELYQRLNQLASNLVFHDITDPWIT